MRHLTPRRYAHVRHRHATLRNGGASLTATTGIPTVETYARAAKSALPVATDKAADAARIPAAARPVPVGHGQLDAVAPRRRPTGAGPRTGTPASREGS
ncbi:hypothetical protein [Streptomyces sp. NPDC059909]|uniref:hypothetical protein n=1 Tax=Streptomyces sp. NPDC059909 TaxID=3346998 RepID=UPI0036541C10